MLSDLYAAGVTKVDSFLTILGLSTKLNEKDRMKVAVELMAGIDSKVKEAGSKVVGGQTVFNPWITTGGSVFGFFDKKEHVIANNETQIGDVIVLTKPIGTQLLVNFNQYFRKDPVRRQKLIDAGLTQSDLDEITPHVHKAMSTLNLYGAKIMNQMCNDIRACTDVTGFGIRGHSDNLVEIQKSNVDFVFDSIPVFKGLKKYENLVRNFKLFEGFAAETSGGLLIVMNKERAQEFITALEVLNHQQAWIVGRVVEGTKKTIFHDNTTFFEV